MKTKVTLISNVIVQEIKKLCECGCGKEVINEKNRFICGHNKSFLRKHHSKESKRKLSQSLVGRKLSKEHVIKLSNNFKGRKHSSETILKMIGQKRSEKTKQNISNSLKGNKLSTETKRKMSQSALGRKHSYETKLKLKFIAKKYIEEHGFSLVMEGKNEKWILDILSNSTGIEILRNDQNISQKIKGLSCDGYLIKHNLPIEILEKHHFKLNGELSNYDQERQIKIARDLNCMIYYISEQEFLSNPKEEIQRFKDFLILLDLERN
jgi:hypothetical protein